MVPENRLTEILRRLFIFSYQSVIFICQLSLKIRQREIQLPHQISLNGTDKTFFSPQVSSLQPEEVEKKWRSVSTHLEAAAVCNKNRMFLTYSSGASILAHPNSLAWLINPRLYEYLTGYVGQSKRFGIVAMDFPGAKLVQTIIGFNY